MMEQKKRLLNDASNVSDPKNINWNVQKVQEMSPTTTPGQAFGFRGGSVSSV